MTGSKKGGTGTTRRRVGTCSFCGKNERDVGPIIEGPDRIFICAGCVDLCSSIIQQEKRKSGRGKALFSAIPTPRQTKEFLDDYVIGQKHA